MSGKRQKTAQHIHEPFLPFPKNVIKSTDRKTLSGQSLMPVNLVKEKSLDITEGREMY